MKKGVANYSKGVIAFTFAIGTGLFGIVATTVFLLVLLGIGNHDTQSHWFNLIAINVRFLFLYTFWFLGAFGFIIALYRFSRTPTKPVILTAASSVSFLIWITLMQLLQTSWWVN